ncbi:unnamed protein product [Musa acuminata subsp. burmannicoides]
MESFTRDAIPSRSEPRHHGRGSKNTHTRLRRLHPPSASLGQQHNCVVSFALLTSF